MSGRKLLGVGLIVAPFVILMLVLSAYAITNFVLTSIVESRSETVPEESVIETDVAGIESTTTLPDSNGDSSDFAQPSGLGEADVATTVGNLINVILGFIGILAILGIIIGVPAGIVLLAMDESDQKTQKK